MAVRRSVAWWRSTRGLDRPRGEAGSMADRSPPGAGLSLQAARAGWAPPSPHRQRDRQPALPRWDQRTQLIRLDYDVGALSVGAVRGMQNDTSPGDLRSTNTTPAGPPFENNLGTAWIEALPLDRWRSR
jgi:hypothetical protein